MGDFKQDMPPPGGYAPITYRRIPLKKGINPKLKLLATVVGSGLAFMYIRKCRFEIGQQRLEDWSAHSALMPMVLAETDRMLLRQLKKNRDAEEKLMKDVKGWEVGKWQHLPVYSTFGPDEYFTPSIREYFAHAPPSDLKAYTHVFAYN